MNIFYTVSKGTFSENINGVKLTNNQDSPFTVGLNINNQLSKNWGVSSSVYLSQLDSAAQEGGSDVNIPFETGMTLYLDYIKNSYMPYFGFDYEQFSTFNTDELSLGESLRIREHKITYATIGFSRFLNFRNKKIFFKTALSFSINSNSNQKSITSNENFNGAKFIAYFNMPISEKWNTHLLVKRHFLKGPTDLTITRIGVGIGHNF